MGTRSITRVQENGKTLVAVYRQSDGYLREHGKDLANFLEGRRIVNGIRLGTEKEVFNGPGCLAANLISFLKSEEFGQAGQFYVYPPDAENEEYSYNINIKTREGGIWGIAYDELPDVTVFAYGETLFSGSSKEFFEFIQKELDK